MQENRPARPGRQQVDQQALAAALAQNAKMAGQVGNIYAGSRITAAPTGQRFISANPQSQQGQMPMMNEATQRAYERTLKQQSQAARQTEMDKRYAEYKAGNPDPWGEGKPWANRDEWAKDLHNATSDYSFDWSGEFGNTQQGYYNALNQDRLAKDAAARAGIQYQTPEVLQNALNKFASENVLDPSMDMSRWQEQDYLNHGYSQQENLLKQKLGLQKPGEMDWVQTGPSNLANALSQQQAASTAVNGGIAPAAQAFELFL